MQYICTNVTYMNEIKKELVSYIENTDDEALLHLLKEECVFYEKEKGKDITDDLSEEQLAELRELLQDPEKDTITLEEFKNATAQWRTK